MKHYAHALLVIVLLAVAGLQTGCDQNEAVTDPESETILSKGGAIAELGDKLYADDDFQSLRKLLHEADQRARLKYFAGANIKRDIAFAKIIEKKKALSASEKSRVAQIRALSAEEIEAVHAYRSVILQRYPEILSLTETELQDVLSAAGVGQTYAVGKTQDACSDCYNAYSRCVSTAEFRHAIEVMSCGLLIETVFGGSVCYLASLAKYLWSINSCTQQRHYCLDGNECLKKVWRDTA